MWFLEPRCTDLRADSFSLGLFPSTFAVSTAAWSGQNAAPWPCRARRWCACGSARPGSARGPGWIPRFRGRRCAVAAGPLAARFERSSRSRRAARVRANFAGLLRNSLCKTLLALFCRSGITIISWKSNISVVVVWCTTSVALENTTLWRHLCFFAPARKGKAAIGSEGQKETRHWAPFGSGDRRGSGEGIAVVGARCAALQAASRIGKCAGFDPPY